MRFVADACRLVHVVTGRQHKGISALKRKHSTVSSVRARSSFFKTLILCEQRVSVSVAGLSSHFTSCLSLRPLSHRSVALTTGDHMSSVIVNSLLPCIES